MPLVPLLETIKIVDPRLSLRNLRSVKFEIAESDFKVSNRPINR